MVRGAEGMERPMAQPAWKLEPEEPAEDARESLLDALRELSESMSMLEEAVEREQKIGEERKRQLATLTVQAEEERQRDAEVRAKVAEQLLRTADCIEGLLDAGSDEASSGEDEAASEYGQSLGGGNGGYDAAADADEEYGEADEDYDLDDDEDGMDGLVEAGEAAAGEEARP